MMECKLARPLHLYYTGYYGSQPPPKSADDYSRTVRRVNRRCSIDTAAELFKVLECVPSFE